MDTGAERSLAQHGTHGDPLSAVREDGMIGDAPRPRVVTLQPHEAESLLRRQRHAARAKPKAIRAYAEEMRAGRWYLNGIPIVLSREGILLDGLQRLSACVECALPLTTFLAEGVRSDVLHTMDQHRRRAFAGVLEARGIPHAHALQAALVKLIHYDDGSLGRGKPAAPTWARLDRTLAANPDLIEAVAESLRLRGSRVPEPVRTPLLFMGRRADPDALARLLASVANPEARLDLPSGVLLRHEIDRIREDVTQNSSMVRLLALAVLALNAVIEGEHVRRLTWIERRPAGRPGDPFPRLIGYAGLNVEAAAPPLPAPPAELPTADAVTCTIEAIDAATAEIYLRANTHNRRVVQAHVEGIARDIAAGRWMFNAHPICFSRSGRLLDGQHRLQAVIASGGVIEVPVVRGVVDEAHATYDIQARRSADFGLTAESFGDQALLAAMANMLWRHELRPPGTRSAKATAAAIHDIVAQHPRLIHLRSFARRMIDYGRGSVMGYGAYVIERDHPELGAAFLRMLETGAQLPEGDPILTLRRTLQRLRHAKASQQDQLDALLQGWARYRARHRKP